MSAITNAAQFVNQPLVASHATPGEGDGGEYDRHQQQRFADQQTEPDDRRRADGEAARKIVTIAPTPGAVI